MIQEITNETGFGLLQSPVENAEIIGAYFGQATLKGLVAIERMQLSEQNKEYMESALYRFIETKQNMVLDKRKALIIEDGGKRDWEKEMETIKDTVNRFRDFADKDEKENHKYLSLLTELPGFAKSHLADMWKSFNIGKRNGNNSMNVSKLGFRTFDIRI